MRESKTPTDSASRIGRVLIIAGSDSGGGAGIQADIKTVTALGGYAATAITAVTVQDTLGVHGVHPIPLEVIEAQARVVLEDIGADAIKTGNAYVNVHTSDGVSTTPAPGNLPGGEVRGQVEHRGH